MRSSLLCALLFLLWLDPSAGFAQTRPGLSATHACDGARVGHRALQMAVTELKPPLEKMTWIILRDGAARASSSTPNGAREWPEALLLFGGISPPRQRFGRLLASTATTKQADSAIYSSPPLLAPGDVTRRRMFLCDCGPGHNFQCDRIGSCAPAPDMSSISTSCCAWPAFLDQFALEPFY